MSTVASPMTGSTSPQNEDTTTFHQYQRLPDELKVMVWKQFAEAEAASRMVIVNVAISDEDDEDEEHPMLDLKILPLKRLKSPLFSVSVLVRDVALEYYATCLDIYERNPPYPYVRHPMREESLEDSAGTPRHPTAYSFPDNPVWEARRVWCHELEDNVSHVADDHLASDVDEIERLSRYRGCVYLNLSTDRFYPFEQWYRTDRYGLRAVAVRDLQLF